MSLSHCAAICSFLGCEGIRVWPECRPRRVPRARRVGPRLPQAVPSEPRHSGPGRIGHHGTIFGLAQVDFRPGGPPPGPPPGNSPSPPPGAVSVSASRPPPPPAVREGLTASLRVGVSPSQDAYIFAAAAAARVPPRSGCFRPCGRRDPPPIRAAGPKARVPGKGRAERRGKLPGPGPGPPARRGRRPGPAGRWPGSPAPAAWPGAAPPRTPCAPPPPPPPPPPPLPPSAGHAMFHSPVPSSGPRAPP